MEGALSRKSNTHPPPPTIPRPITSKTRTISLRNRQGFDLYQVRSVPRLHSETPPNFLVEGHACPRRYLQPDTRRGTLRIPRCRSRSSCQGHHTTVFEVRDSPSCKPPYTAYTTRIGLVILSWKPRCLVFEHGGSNVCANVALYQ